MTVELTYLTYAVVLLFLHMFVQAAFSDLSKGILWAIGPQDETREQNVIAGRIQRAFTNYVYNFPAFIALVLTLKVTELGNEGTALGAAVWFWARVAYVPAYTSGIPLLRTVAWLASLIGIAMMLLPLLGY